MRVLCMMSMVTAILCGCAARPAGEGRDVIVEGLEQIMAFGGAAAAYRAETGRWPSVAADLANAPGAPAAERLAHLDRFVRLSPGERALVVIDRRTGDPLFEIRPDGGMATTTASRAGARPRVSH
jgi:hypothetical protein